MASVSPTKASTRAVADTSDVAMRHVPTPAKRPDRVEPKPPKPAKAAKPAASGIAAPLVRSAVPTPAPRGSRTAVPTSAPRRGVESAAAEVPYGPPYVERAEVRAFIREMAAKHGIDAAVLTAAFTDVPQRLKPAPTKPGEASGEDLPFFRYLRLFNTPENVERGVRFAHDHAAAFALAKERYDVDAEAILGILSVETKFGTVTSRGPVLSALVQRAFDGGRTTYFRGELDAFLGLCVDRGWKITEPQGSSAGAMGYMQFMPSNVANLMVSSEPGRKPDPYNANDAVLSIGNYLENAFPSRAWRPGEPSAVKLSAKAKPQGRLYTVEGESGPERWDLRPNHATFLAYNQSDLYALTVGIMGRLIDAKATKPVPVPTPAPAKERPAAIVAR